MTNQAGKLLGNALTRFRSVTATMALGSAVWVTEAAHAVNDLPGGPAVNQLNFAPPATKIAEEQHWLHWFMMAICAVIFVVVFGVMFYSIVKHRQENPHHHHRQRRDPRLHGAGLRHQAGRHPRLRARHLVPRRKDR